MYNRSGRSADKAGLFIIESSEGLSPLQDCPSRLKGLSPLTGLLLSEVSSYLGEKPIDGKDCPSHFIITTEYSGLYNDKIEHKKEKHE